MDENLANLIRKLRDETSFVQSEKKHLIDLYKQVVKKSEKLFQKQWSIGHQHLIIEDLIFARGNNKINATQACRQFFKLTDQINFIESHKVIGHNDYHISEFFKALRENPKHLAAFIIKSEKCTQMAAPQLISGVDNQLYFSNQIIIPLIFQSIFGNCVLNQDEVYCLQVLKNLIELQFSSAHAIPSNPDVLFNNTNSNQSNDFYSNNIDLRRLIRKQSCSFNILFRFYTSFAFSTQLFLHTSLHEPITQVLNDEWFLDIDPDKALGRFSQEEIINHFGQPNSKEYKVKTQKYREKIVNQLFTMTLSFIESINANLYCFPQSLTWLVNQLYHTVTRNYSRNQNSHQDLARKLCCDLIMALYICPAICDPEPYGIISDIQITPVARHNLMQIANILQVLAMSDDDKDIKAQDLYYKFRNNCVSEILNSLIWPTTLRNGNESINDLNLFSMQAQLDHTQTIVANGSVSSSSASLPQMSTLLSRTSLMISLTDIHRLLIFTKQITKESNLIENSNDDLKKWLKSILPNSYLNQALETACTDLTNSSPLGKLPQSNPNSLKSLTGDISEVITAIMTEKLTENDNCQVLVMNISNTSFDCPGMLNEEKVIKDYESKEHKKNENSNTSNRHHHHYHHRSSRNHTLKRNQTNDESDILDSSYEPSNNSRILRNCFMGSPHSMSQNIELRTYPENTGVLTDTLSSSDDEETNDRTSKHDLNQILDDIDDANQLEQLRDGLSDFDTFSGRDTPIISGRDTPSSHSHEDLNVSNVNKNTAMSSQNRNDVAINNPIPNNLNNLRGPQLPITVQKANREDINDKFCKFEINKACNMPLREEQMSEAWSLDADPPESVTNEVINDPLDENTSTTNLSINSSNQASNISRTSKSVGNIYANTTSISNNLMNMSNEQDSNSAVVANIPVTSGFVQAPSVLNNSSVDKDLNLEGDRLSMVSDSTAWSTDLINNSDSDLESNSPSKYTPYSTYSSCSSQQHPSINHSAFFQSSYSLNQNNSSNNNVPNSVGNVINNSMNNNAQNITANASPSIVTAASSGIDLIKNAVKNIDSSLNNWNFDNLSLNNIIKNKNSTNQSSSNSISNASNIKTSTSNQILATQSKKPNSQKRGGLHRLFSMNSNKSSNINSNSQPQTPSASTINTDNSKTNSSADNIDNILKKYANKTQAASQAPILNEGVLIDLSDNIQPTLQSPSPFIPKNSSANILQPLEKPIFYDLNDLEQSKAFLDAKKKLRIVLSWPDCFSFIPLSNNKSQKENFLKMYLKTQLYEAISLQDKEKEAQLYETIRCVSIFTDQDCYKLLRALKKDYNRRIFYMTYLTKSKQNILYSLNLIEKLVQRSKWHQTLCTTHLTSVVTRQFLESKANDEEMSTFVNQFRNLPSLDEKFDLYKSFINKLKDNLSLIWHNCQDDIVKLGDLSLERLVIPKVYRYAMFPNGEIDQFRDSKVSECLSELASTITPSHPLIGIPSVYENECPWSAAQMELRRLNIFKTPQDKLECIKKCMLTIQNLLAIAKSPVCADDLHPVLIYVIIKANPPTFLSNVQFIEGFYGKELESIDYYWAQFIFAFSYIKANMLGNKVTPA